MDFVSDALFDGRRFRALTIIDQHTRECLAIHADQSIKSEQVVSILKGLVSHYGVPKRIQTDNGSEFANRAFDKWAYEHPVTLDFSRPGRPTDNPFIKSFNGSFRDECLNTTGSYHSKTLGRRSNRGGKNITTFVRIQPWAICRLDSSPRVS